MSDWSFWVCDTRTGVKQLQLTPASGSWSRKLNASGSGSHVFQLAPGDGIPWRSLVVPWSRTIVVCRHDIPVYAGVIQNSVYDQPTMTLTVNHTDIRDIFAKRYPFGTAGYWSNAPTDTIPGALVCTNLSLRAIAAAVVGAAVVGPFATYSLPIVLPSATEAGSASMTFQNYNFVAVADALTTIQALGPDIDFQPSWSASNTLQWTMRTGTPTVPAMTGSVFEWNMSTPKPALAALSVTVDGGKQLTGQFTVGTGSEQDMVVGGIGLGLAATIPALDIVNNQKSIDNAPALAAYSTAALAAYSAPTTQWAAGILANDPVAPVETLLLGSTFRMFFEGDPWIPDGWASCRLIGYAGDMTETIVPTFQ